MASQIDELRSAAEIAARRGGEVLRRRFEEARTIDLKGQIDLVTDADHAAERAILEFVRAEFPAHRVIAEEIGQVAPASPPEEGPNSGLCWYIDPLDGTTNYAHRVPHFCVSVAVWDGEGPLAGAIYQPLLDDLYSAGRGVGATCNGELLGVSHQPSLSQALIATGFPYDIWTKPEDPLRLFAAVLGKARGVRRFGAAALDLAYVARGRFDGYFELGLHPWDVAAGILLVQESGGQVSDLRGGGPRVGDRQIIAANPPVHRDLVQLLAPLAP
jgi:myo-inositol-1(or 4)-monophosphatase